MCPHLEIDHFPATKAAHQPVDPGMEGLLPEEIPFLRAFLRRLVVGCPALEIDDLQQQTMDRALKFQHRYDATRPLRPWLHTIAFRVFLDARADAKRGPQTLAPEEQKLPITAAPQHTREELESLLQRLPDPQGDILHRFYLQEQSIPVIARALSLPTGTVKSHLHRARRRLASEQSAEAWL